MTMWLTAYSGSKAGIACQVESRLLHYYTTVAGSAAAPARSTRPRRGGAVESAHGGDS